MKLTKLDIVQAMVLKGAILKKELDSYGIFLRWSLTYKDGTYKTNIRQGSTSFISGHPSIEMFHKDKTGYSYAYTFKTTTS